MARTRRVNYYMVGLDELGEFVENRSAICEEAVMGCSLDNALYYIPGYGYAAAYETVLNEWSATYRVVLERDPAPHLLKEWEDFVGREKAAGNVPVGWEEEC